MERLPHLHTARPDWPELAPPGQFLPDDRPVPAEQWPALNLRWWDISPTVLEPESFARSMTESLLEAVGVPAPAARVLYKREYGARHGRWIWICEVHVVGAPVKSAACCNYDCTENGRSTTRDGAREAALIHVRDGHPDAAVPYLGRRDHALRRWA
ncbi:hypothetical protein ACFY3M_13695 [Streptomyces mirabilis]|uniref:hypothetical protein n=2 Tax=Streptomyces mirabilis TaxID=68239 RepID=UPI00367DA830